MEKFTIAVCDINERYALSLSGLLQKRMGEVCTVKAFSTVESLVSNSAMQCLDAIIITETAFTQSVTELRTRELIILKEKADFEKAEAFLIERFQESEALVLAITDRLGETCEMMPQTGRRNRGWKVIGVYSPVKRCLQTTFSMTLGQMLAGEHRVLYMNFENYSGISGLLNREFEMDVVDLLYFFDCDREKLASRIQSAVHSIGGMDILPPAASYLDTYERSGAKWIEFFEAIESVTDYEYLILDLTDAMQGLMDVLFYCKRIYTMVKNDEISRAKLAQYETWMVSHSNVGIMSKTLRFDFPQFNDLPMNPEMLTKSELAAYVRTIVKEDAWEKI